MYDKTYSFVRDIVYLLYYQLHRKYFTWGKDVKSVQPCFDKTAKSYTTL